MGIKRMWGNLGRWVRCALSGRSVALLLIGAAVLMLIGTLIRGVSGSPYQSGLMLQCGHIIPPVWLMTLLWMLWYALLGAAFVWVMSDRRCDPHTQSIKYGGGMTFLAMLFLGFLWYPVFFCAGRIFLAALLLLAVLVLCVLTALCYVRAFRGVAIILFAHALFLVWMLILNIAAVFEG